MQFRQFILAASLVIAPIACIGSTPAQAATVCSCTDIIFPSGVCRQYGKCHVLATLAPGGDVKPIRSLKSCPAKKQSLVCDGETCTVTCSPPAQ